MTRGALFEYIYIYIYTYLYLYRLPPEQVQHSLFMLLIEEDILGFNWGKGPKSYPEKRPVCRIFSIDALTERPEVAGYRKSTSWIFTTTPLSGL